MSYNANMVGQGQLVEQLKDCAYAIMEYRLVQDYGHHVVTDWETLENLSLSEQRLKKLLFKQSNFDWVEMAEHLQFEDTDLEDAQRATFSRPETPWLDGLRRAIDIVGPPMTTQQLFWEICECARRKENREWVQHYPVCHNSSKNLIEKSDWVSLAQKIVEDLRSLRLAFPTDKTRERARMQRAIEKLRDHYFLTCEQKSDGSWRVRVRIRPEMWRVGSMRDGRWEESDAEVQTIIVDGP